MAPDIFEALRFHHSAKVENLREQKAEGSGPPGSLPGEKRSPCLPSVACSLILGSCVVTAGPRPSAGTLAAKAGVGAWQPPSSLWVLLSLPAVAFSSESVVSRGIQGSGEVAGWVKKGGPFLVSLVCLRLVGLKSHKFHHFSFALAASLPGVWSYLVTFIAFC